MTAKTENATESKEEKSRKEILAENAQLKKRLAAMESNPLSKKRVTSGIVTRMKGVAVPKKRRIYKHEILAGPSSVSGISVDNATKTDKGDSMKVGTDKGDSIKLGTEIEVDKSAATTPKVKDEMVSKGELLNQDETTPNVARHATECTPVRKGGGVSPNEIQQTSEVETKERSTPEPQKGACVTKTEIMETTETEIQESASKVQYHGKPKTDADTDANKSDGDVHKQLQIALQKLAQEREARIALEKSKREQESKSS